MELCIYDDVFDTIQISNEKLLHFKLSKSGQNLCVDKIAFSGPGHMYIHCSYVHIAIEVNPCIENVIVATYCHLILIALGVLS